MTQSLSHRLDATARNLVPAALGVFLAILSAIPFYLPGFGPVAPNYVLMVVFFWAVHRPDILSPVRVFFIGLLLDILVGMPPGLNAAVLVLVWALTSSQNRVFRGKSFLVLWWGFGLVALAASFVVWLLSCIYNLALLDPMPGLFQAGVTIALFPFLAWLFVWTQHKLLPQG